MAKSAAWQRKEGKNPAGGLNAKGRASYKRGIIQGVPPSSRAWEVCPDQSVIRTENLHVCFYRLTHGGPRQKLMQKLRQKLSLLGIKLRENNG